MLLVGQSTRHECVTFILISCRNAGAILLACPLLAVLRERMSEFRYGMWRLYDSEHRHTVYPETIQSTRIFTSFCQPTMPITCANHGNHVQTFMKPRQSTT